MKKKLNLLFIILFIFIIGLIGIFNYIIDPYDILHSKYNYLHIGDYNKNLIGTLLNISKNKKFNYLIMGSSTTYCFFHRNVIENKSTLFMITEQFDFVSQVEYLKYILDIHPEIDTIIFPIEYAFFSVNDTEKTPEIQNQNMILGYFQNLFFSSETTLKSIKKAYLFISNFPNSLNQIKQENKLFSNNDNFNHKITDEIFEGTSEAPVFEKRNYSDCLNKPINNNKYNALKSLKELMEKKNKKIIFIFPPYHALTQAYIYKTKKNNEIQNLKRYIVNNFPKSEVIDFSYINKYTSEPLSETYNYVDIIHPQGEPGHLFYCTLKYLDEFKKKDLYVKLSKNNIEETINWQERRLEEYIEKNNKNINDFINLPLELKDKKTIKMFYLPKNCKYYIDNY